MVSTLTPNSLFARMEVTIIGQGLKPENQKAVGHYLIEFLTGKDFHTFTAISAFASEAGIRGLSPHIVGAKERFKHLNIVVGIDQEGTSKEALEAILALEIESYIFYQPSVTIFHPKIYLFEGDQVARLIIGSSNITAQGLFSNVEASALLLIDQAVDADRQIVRDIKKHFATIFTREDPNLKKLTQELIEDLVELRVVPTEAERRMAQKEEAVSSGKTTTSSLLISEIFPKRKIASIPSEFKKKRAVAQATSEAGQMSVGKPSAKGILVWTRKSLPASSVQAAGSGTNPTGGLRLVQDKFEVGGQRIDQTRYFRETLFGGYAWNQIRTNPPVEAATVPFEVSIRGEFLGKFDLEIRHKPSGEAGQHNYTTSISWGALGKTVREAELTRLQLNLYAPVSSGGSFHIEIV